MGPFDTTTHGDGLGRLGGKKYMLLKLILFRDFFCFWFFQSQSVRFFFFILCLLVPPRQLYRRWCQKIVWHFFCNNKVQIIIVQKKGTK